MYSHPAVPSVPATRGVYRADFTIGTGATRLFALNRRGELAAEVNVFPGVDVGAAREVLAWLLDELDPPTGPRLVVS